LDATRIATPPSATLAHSRTPTYSVIGLALRTPSRV